MKLQFSQSYHIKHMPTQLSKILMAFLTRNHHLPIEVGRWRNIPANERLCPTCADIGDEYHYVMICPNFRNQRKKYLSQTIYSRPSMAKFLNLLNSSNYLQIKKLCLFCKEIREHFC